jgi:hypothetical protein
MCEPVQHKAWAFYYWRHPHELWFIAVAWRLMFGAKHTPGVKTWSFGPVTVGRTKLVDIIQGNS